MLNIIASTFQSLVIDMYRICCKATLLALLIGSSSTSMACTAPGHHTNEELVRDAEAIVLARVIGGTSEHFENPAWESIELIQFISGQGPGPKVKFDVVETLKGNAPGGTISLVGSLRYFGPNTNAAPYSLARPGSQRGTCFAYDYKLGGTFLLLLKKGTPYWSEVRPTNEEISGPRDAWLLWVRSQLKQRTTQRSAN